MTDVRVYRNIDALSRAIVDRIVAEASAAADEGRQACLALSGGQTPVRAYAMLAEPTVCAAVRWRHLRLFWVDERDVPPESPDSNFGTAREVFLKKAPIEPRQVFPIRLWDYGMADAPTQFETVLRRHVPRRDNGIPRFDLVLLGMGMDGHTASLFPRTPALFVTDRLCVGNHGPAGSARATMTYPILNAARKVVIAVSGASKAKAVHKALRGERDIPECPVQGIAPDDGDLLWALDPEAASLL